MDKVDDVPLGRVCVAVFQLEHLLDSIVFEYSEVDEETQWPCQVSTKDQVLLSSDLYM